MPIIDPDGAEAQTDAERQEPTPYHGAVFNAVSYRLHKYKENGDVALIDEHRLSKEPLRIDIIVVKKNRDVELEPCWAKIFRGRNLIEYKSPVDKPPTLAVFNKLIGYAYIYAAQEEVKISDVTATLICADPPEKLFTALEDEFGYEILQKGDGIYYIIQKWAAVEKTLAIQVAAQTSDLLLQALDKRTLDTATMNKVADFTFAEGLKNKEQLGYWLDVVLSEYLSNIGEGGGNMEPSKRLADLMESTGYSDIFMQKGQLKGRQEGRQEGLQEGLQEGMRKVISLLEKGYSLEDAKKMLKLA